LACQTIEKVHAVGYEHLIDKEMVKKVKSLNCCLECLCNLIMLGIFAALVTFTVLYFLSSALVDGTGDNTTATSTGTEGDAATTGGTL